MATSEVKSFLKYFFFAFTFIVAFSMMQMRTIEIFGMSLFFIVNILFFIFIGKDLTDGSVSPEGKNYEWTTRYGILLISMVLSFVSSIMMALAIVNLQKKFAEKQSGIKWSPKDRKKMDDSKILFITITVFIAVVALYVYNSPDNIRKFTYTIFDTILNGDAANWLRVLSPIAILGLGSALYGRLETGPIEVNTYPTLVICDPKNNTEIQQFKDSVIKTFWFLFAFVVIVLARPFIEANFNISGLSPSTPFGFSHDERSFIFGQNPSISILSLLTLGISNLSGLNRYLEKKMNSPDGTKWFSFLLLPIFRWDVLYLLAKYAFGIVGLVYAGFTIRDFKEIPETNACLFKNAHIRQLYIAFIVFLITFYAFNTLTASNFTSLTTNIMRYLVPPSLLGMSSYLIFITNHFMKTASQLVLE